MPRTNEYCWVFCGWRQVGGDRRTQETLCRYLCVSPSVFLRFSRHYGPKRWGWGEQRERCARAAANLARDPETARPSRARAQSHSSTLPPFPWSGLLRAPDWTLAPRTRASSFLDSPPTAPEAARGTTWVYLSLAGIATFLPGLWGLDRITMICSKVHLVGWPLFASLWNSFCSVLRLIFVILLSRRIRFCCPWFNNPASASGPWCCRIIFSGLIFSGLGNPLYFGGTCTVDSRSWCLVTVS